MIDIPTRLDEMTARRIKGSPHQTNRASEIGHPCVRFLVLSRTSEHLRTLHDVGLQRIFDEGKIQEKAVLRELEDAGFEVIEQQRPLDWPKYQLTGTLDAKLMLDEDGKRRTVPLEIKSCSPFVFPKIKELSPVEMIHSTFPWVRKYPAQILFYMLLSNEDTGIMIFKNKANGEKCQKEFHLEGELLEYAESILKNVEAVNGHVALGTCPDAKLIDDCKGCPFAKTACFPGGDYGPGFDILSDPDLEAKLDRHGELEAAAKEFKALDEEIKDGFKGKPTAVVGGWIIESKPYDTTVYPDLPKDIKAKYAVKKTAYRTSIQKL